MTEAYTLKNQLYNDTYYSTLELAEILGIYTYISAPLFQGRILRPLDEKIKKLFKVEKDIYVPIQFVRSTPGVGTVLIGMSKLNHLIENIHIENYPKLTNQEFICIIQK